MKWILSVILLPLMLGQTPTMQPWVDPAKVQGSLLISVEFRIGGGVYTWGSVRDPDGDLFDMTLNAPAGVTFAPDPNGAYNWTWHPTPSQVGVHYIVLTAKERLVPNLGNPLTTMGTFAVKVNPPNQSPVITHGGCRILQ